MISFLRCLIEGRDLLKNASRDIDTAHCADDFFKLFDKLSFGGRFKCQGAVVSRQAEASSLQALCCLSNLIGANVSPFAARICAPVKEPHAIESVQYRLVPVSGDLTGG